MMMMMMMMMTVSLIYTHYESLLQTLKFLRITGFGEFGHRLEFKMSRKQRFRNLFCFCNYVKGRKHLLCWVPAEIKCVETVKGFTRAVQLRTVDILQNLLGVFPLHEKISKYGDKWKIHL
jgi:hypothetical protein